MTRPAVKRTLALILVALTLTLSFSALASNKSDEKRAQAIVTAANAKIEAVTTVICKLAAGTKGFVADTFAALLVATTNAIAQDAIYRAEQLGVTVICEYKEVLVGDNLVLVDPLIVFGP